MSAPTPCVSICLPVYNGERYVGAAIDSVLAQTLQDFELIIADNASTDSSGELCRKAARRDTRIRYLPAERNGGLAWNFNRACRAARGCYLVWLSCDDVMTPDYLRSCVAALDADPGAVLCFTNRNNIDELGAVRSQLELVNTGSSAAPSERFQHVLDERMCEPVCGVMRMEVVRQTRLHQAFADSDRVLLAELALRGRFRKLDDILFSRRFHAGAATATIDRWARTVIFDPGKAGKLIFPWWRELFALVGAVLRAPLAYAERQRTLKQLYWWARAHRRVLVGDLRRGLDLLTHSSET